MGGSIALASRIAGEWPRSGCWRTTRGRCGHSSTNSQWRASITLGIQSIWFCPTSAICWSKLTLDVTCFTVTAMESCYTNSIWDFGVQELLDIGTKRALALSSMISSRGARGEVVPVLGNLIFSDSSKAMADQFNYQLFFAKKKKINSVITYVGKSTGYNARTDL